MKTHTARLWRSVTLEELDNIVTPPLGSRHVPLKHSDSVKRFEENLVRNNIVVVNRSMVISVDNMRYIHTVEVAKADMESEYSFITGFVNYNDTTKCWTGLAGTKHSDGLVFTTSHIPESRRKHTISLLNVVDDKIDSTVDMFKKYMISRRVEIEYLKSIEADAEGLGRFILAMLRDKNPLALSAVDVQRILTHWDTPPREDLKDRTMWTLHKILALVTNPTPNPVRRMECLERTINLAREAFKLD